MQPSSLVTPTDLYVTPHDFAIYMIWRARVKTTKSRGLCRGFVILTD
jgi:hypothetical protein